MTVGRPAPPDPRLRQRRIETRAKPVTKAQSFVDAANVGADPALEAELFDIIDSIGQGRGIPEKYYRAGIDDGTDELLSQHGVMHIHLGGKNSDVLVYLVQYDDSVVLLRTGTHAELQITPPGSVLRSIMRGALSTFDRVATTIRAQAEAQRLKIEEELGVSQRTRRARSFNDLRAAAQKRGEEAARQGPTSDED